MLNPCGFLRIRGNLASRATRAADSCCLMPGGNDGERACKALRSNV